MENEFSIRQKLRMIERGLCYHEEEQTFPLPVPKLSRNKRY